MVVVGREDPAPYRDFAARLGVQDRLTFVSEADPIEDFYSGADVFAFPSHYEAFGLSLLEAMASGLPVVCTKHLGAAELMTDGKDALHLDAWDDPLELAAKVNELGPDARRNFGREARKLAEQYPWERAAARMRGAYESCLRR